MTGTPEQVAAAKEEVSKYASRIHVSSYVMIALGLVSLIGSIYHGLNARRGAEKWLAKGAEWAHKIHGDKNATVPEPTGTEYVT